MLGLPANREWTMSMGVRISAVLFDLGNTLAAYYRREEFAPILESCVRGALAELDGQGLGALDFDAAYASALNENREARDFRVRPLVDRLPKIFRLDARRVPPKTIDVVIRRFLEPIFTLGRRYGDSAPTLRRLRAEGYRTAIVSNSPWGSPADLWRRELARLELSDADDATVFCGDVGWRKPAPAIFDHAVEQLEVRPEQCAFVGDDPCWDIEGATTAGMRALLIDREGHHPDFIGRRITTLTALTEHLE